MRVGVMGLGRIGHMHARNFAQTTGVDEVVLIGRDAERTTVALAAVEASLQPDAPRELAGNHAPGNGTAALRATTCGPSAALKELDAVVIATSTATHPELTLLAAHAGIPTLVEKPLALDQLQLNALADEIDTTGTDVAVAFHRRYDPAHQQLRDHVRNGDVGTVRLMRAAGHDHLPLSLDYIPASGGIWLDMLVHDFDSIPWVAGERVTRVFATGSVLDEPRYTEYDDVDTCAAVLTLESGAIATVTGARRNGAGQDVRLEVCGSSNSYAAGLDAAMPLTSTEPDVPAPTHSYDQFIDRFEIAFRSEAAHFVRMAAGDAPNLTPPRAGLHAIQIAVAAAASIRTKLPVAIPSPGTTI